MHSKHILFISSWYPVPDKPTHGIFNRYFAEAAALYNKVSVLHVSSGTGLNNDFEIQETTESGIHHVRVFYKKVNSDSLWAAFLKRRKLLKAFDKGYARLLKSCGRPDLIQLNVAMPLGIGALSLARQHRLPYLVNENWSGYTKEDGNYKGFFLKMITARILNGASFILPTSNYLRDAMVSQGLKGEYRVVPNVVNTGVFKPMALPKDESFTRFIHISSLNDREKNVSGIIRAFYQALLENRTLELLIVGEGVDEPVYRKLTTALKIEQNVRFAGRLMSEELARQINLSDALVMFSNYETFCLVNIEAFACGKPVITSNAGAIPEYMHPSRGVVVPVGDEIKLKTALLELAAEKHKYKTEEIRDFAVKNFSYEEVGKQLSAIYNQVLSHKK